jgi:hypothetical protein
MDRRTPLNVCAAQATKMHNLFYYTIFLFVLQAHTKNFRSVCENAPAVRMASSIALKICFFLYFPIDF